MPVIQLTMAILALTLGVVAAAFAQCVGCIGPVPPNPSPIDFLPPPQQVAIKCAQKVGQDAREFARCTGGYLVLSSQGQAMLDCTASSSTKTEFAVCGAMVTGIKLSDEQRILANCAMKSKGASDSFISCAGTGLVDRQLTPQQRTIVRCAANANGDSTAFAACSATQLFGPRLSKEQQMAVRCAAESGDDTSTFVTCAGSKFLDLDLNPEQRIAVECVVETGGQPYAAAGCIGTRLSNSIEI